MERLDIIKYVAVKGKTVDEWRRFWDVFETCLIATEKDGKEETVKIALLKVLRGRIIVDEYNLLFGDAPAKTLKQWFSTFFLPCTPRFADAKGRRGPLPLFTRK